MRNTTSDTAKCKPKFVFPLSGKSLRCWNSEESLRLSNTIPWKSFKGFFTVVVLTLNISPPWFLSKPYLLITTNCHTLSVFTCGNYNEQLHFTKMHLTDFRLMAMANKCAPAFDEHICAAWNFHARRVNVFLTVGRQIETGPFSMNTYLQVILN